MLFYVKTKTESLKCIWRVLLHHFLVVLVGEVEHRLHDFELVEDLVVSRHVGGQNAPADGNIHGTVKKKKKRFHHGGRERGSDEVSLDHPSSDLLVLLGCQVLQDVALGLRRERHVTTFKTKESDGVFI